MPSYEIALGEPRYARLQRSGLGDSPRHRHPRTIFRRRHAMKLLLDLATLLGGASAVWFFAEKISSIVKASRTSTPALAYRHQHRIVAASAITLTTLIGVAVGVVLAELGATILLVLCVLDIVFLWVCTKLIDVSMP